MISDSSALAAIAQFVYEIVLAINNILIFQNLSNLAIRVGAQINLLN